MKRSTDRILTTHAGSLPRPPDILEKLAAKQQAAFDEPAMAARLTGAVAEIVRKQVELGVDVVDDGEQGKVGFIPYINERLAGFELDTTRPAQSPWAGSREAKAFLASLRGFKEACGHDPATCPVCDDVCLADTVASFDGGPDH